METREKTKSRSKKDKIRSLFASGVTDIETISVFAGARPSYVASVLQREGLIDNYFDLYTSTARPMNVYSKHFNGKLGFRDVESAKRSVEFLDNAYGYFEDVQDRAGQHHALDMGLTMFDRARWTGKLEEAEIYRQWLVGKLSKPLIETSRPQQVASVSGADDQSEDEIKRAA